MKTLFDSNLTLEEAEVLLKNGANVNVMNIYDLSTPLYRFDKADMISLLIENGADINHLNDGRITPLKHHYSRSHDDIMQLLIKTGAVPDTVDFYFLIKHLYPKEKQNEFDVYALLSQNDNDFFQMCLAYQNDQKNHVKIEIKEMEIL